MPEASAGSAVAWKAASQSITGLEWETTYHYRLVVTRGSEAIYGEDRTFTTVPWVVEATPSTTGLLWGISCLSSSACIAVGGEEDLAEHWNGTEWNVQAVTIPSGGTESSLRGVACSSATVCTAVGGYKDSSGTEVSLAERWNGAEWAIQATPNPSGALKSTLEGVSCTSSSTCTAVGWYENSASERWSLAERWNGKEWSLQSTPSATGEIEADEVSCPSRTSCVADRSYFAPGGGGEESTVERWDGVEWHVQKLSAPEYEGHAAEEVALRGVSCVTSTDCTVVGSFWVQGYGAMPLAEHWNGTEWQVQSTPRAPGAGFNNLRAVSCVSSSACTAAGQNDNEEDFAERWNGKTWTLQTMAVVPGLDYLEGIACLPPDGNICTTVGGSDFGGGALQPFIQREVVPGPVVENSEAMEAHE